MEKVYKSRAVGTTLSLQRMENGVAVGKPIKYSILRAFPDISPNKFVEMPEADLEALKTTFVNNIQKSFSNDYPISFTNNFIKDSAACGGLNVKVLGSNKTTILDVGKNKFVQID